MDTTVAETILQQLGGNRFMVMTGSKVDNVTENSIRFKLGRGAKLTAFEVILTPDDTYNVGCFVGTGINRRHAKDPLHDVYAEDLVAVFERETGFYTKF